MRSTVRVLDCRRVGYRQANDKGGSVSGGGFDVQFSSMPLDDSVDHRESESRAALALRREERFEATLAHAFRHAGAVVADADHGVVVFNRRLERNAATL